CWWSHDGQLDQERRASPGRALDPDRTPVLLDDALAERESESRSLAARLRREEGFEDTRLDFRRNSRPRVADLEVDPGVITLESCREGDPSCRRDVSHGVSSIDDEIDQNLVEPVRSRPERRQILSTVEDDLDAARAQFVGQELDRLLDHVVESYLAPFGRTLAREREEVADDAHAALGRRVDPLRSPFETAVLRRMSEEMSLADDDRQRVVQLVGDAGQTPAHRCDLLSLQEALAALTHAL